MPGSMCPRTAKPKCRILYVGADLGLIDGLRKALRKVDYEVDCEVDYQVVSCGEREGAIMFLKSDISYQLLLIDFEWREREGLKLASLARLLKHRKFMPAVLVTVTEFSRGLKALARNAGVNECVAKTPDMGALIETIRRLTEGLIGSAD